MPRAMALCHLVAALLFPVAAPSSVALVFVGHARSFHRPAVHESIKRRLVDGLGSGDVFWYFAEEPGWSDATRTTLVRLFAPVATAVHAEEEPAGAWHGACAAPPLPDVEGLGVPPTFKFYGDPPRAAAIARAMFAKLRGALALVAAREAALGRRYDWIARCRFDWGWFGTLPPLDAWPRDRLYVPTQTWNGVNDQFALAPRDLADVYFDAADALDACDEATGYPAWHALVGRDMVTGCDASGLCGVNVSRHEPAVWQPETMLWTHLKRKGARASRHTFPAAITRLDGTSRCLELMPHVLLSTVLDAAFEELVAGARAGKRTANVLKTAHVSACAARFPCCHLLVNADGADVNVSLDIHAPIQASCDALKLGPRRCELLEEHLRTSSAVADDDTVAGDVAFLAGRAAALARVDPDAVVIVQVNSAPPVASASPDGARDAAPFSSRFAVLANEAHATALAFLCAYLERVPRAEALAAARGLGGVLDVECAAAAAHLHAAETAVHGLVDDDALTNPSYATTRQKVLGWEVWTVPFGSCTAHVPETPFSAPLRAAKRRGNEGG